VLENTAEALRRQHPGIEVRCVSGDIAAPGVRERALAAAPCIDILVNNASGPPPGNFRDRRREQWLARWMPTCSRPSS